MNDKTYFVHDINKGPNPMFELSADEAFIRWCSMQKNHALMDLGLLGRCIARWFKNGSDKNTHHRSRKYFIISVQEEDGGTRPLTGKEMRAFLQEHRQKIAREKD